MSTKFQFMLNKVLRRSAIAFLVGIIAGPQTAIAFFAALFIIDAIAGQVWKMILMYLKKSCSAQGIHLPIVDSDMPFAYWDKIYVKKLPLVLSDSLTNIKDVEHVTVFTSGFMDPVCTCYHVKDGLLTRTTMSECIKSYQKTLETHE